MLKDYHHVHTCQIHDIICGKFFPGLCLLTALLTNHPSHAKRGTNKEFKRKTSKWEDEGKLRRTIISYVTFDSSKCVKYQHQSFDTYVTLIWSRKYIKDVFVLQLFQIYINCILNWCIRWLYHRNTEKKISICFSSQVCWFYRSGKTNVRTHTLSLCSGMWKTRFFQSWWILA